MQLFPDIRLAFPGGWTLIVGFYILFFLFLRSFPKEVTTRLYELSGWQRVHPLINRIVRLATFTRLAIFIATPLSSDPRVLQTGLILFFLGFAGLFSALLTYARSPLDGPVTGGLYRFSRNPQWIFMALMMLGNCVVIGSWTALILLAISVLGYHFRLLGEEEVLTEQYGDSYRDYLRQVPRYLLFV